MKNNMIKRFFAIVVALVLCMGMSTSTFAAINPFAAMEARSHQALDAAIKAGTVPAGLTIFDCSFTRGDDGITRVIQYRDKNGNWIDVGTNTKVVEQKPTNTPTIKTDNAQKIPKDTLAEYAAEVFRLVNVEREKAGLEPLERSAELDNAASIRAEELSRNFSHTRPDGTRFYTVMGVEKNYNYGENGGSSGETPKNQMQGWMNSEGHRSNILDINELGYTQIGIGVFQDNSGKMYWCQLFYRPI